MQVRIYIYIYLFIYLFIYIYIYIHTYVYIYIHKVLSIYVYIYIYIYIFTGPLALGVLDHSRVTEVDLSIEIYPPYSPPGAVLGPKVAALWLSCGLAVA